jgi:sialic acid synthase SpsE
MIFGSSDRVSVVAELTSNHGGNPAQLLQMAAESFESGADYIKLQKRNVETFYTEQMLASNYESPYGTTLGAYRRALEITVDDATAVDEVARDYGKNWFFSVLDYDSFRFAMQFEPEILKIPSTVSNHRNFITRVAKEFQSTIVVSTGMTNGSYESFILDTFSRCNEIVLMQCTSAYPTPPEAAHIAVVRHYRDLSKEYHRIVPGYSSHDLGWLGSCLAVAAGAKVVEKHVRFGETDWLHFRDVALDLRTGEFREYVNHIRNAETILGSESKEILAIEHHKYDQREAPLND